MDDEGVLQVLHGALHPVVEGGGSFCELQVKLVDGFQQLLRSLLKHRQADLQSLGLRFSSSSASPAAAAAHLQSLAAFLGQGAQSVPLVADPLAARVHAGGVVIVQLAAAHRGHTRLVSFSSDSRGASWLLPPYFNSCAMAAICSTRSWCAARSLSNASCFFSSALISDSVAVS